MKCFCVSVRHVLLAVLLAGVPAFADSYTFTTVDVPGKTSTRLSGINDAGELIGTFTQSAGDPNKAYGFLDVNGSFTTIVPPQSTGSQVWGINNSGQITGMGDNNSFLYANGTFTTITSPNPVDGPPSAAGINNSGQITGNISQVINLAGRPPMGFLDTNGTFTYFKTADMYTFGQGINDRGEIVGYAYTNPEFIGVDGFVNSNGAISLLDVPGAFGTEAFGVNNAGTVVGTYYYSVFGPDNFDNGFVETNGIFSTVNVPGAIDTEVFDINNEGDIVGSYVDSSGIFHGFVGTPTAVPEPMSLSLLVLGFAGIGGIGARRRAASRKD